MNNKISFACVKGKAHLKAKTPCQDRTAFHKSEENNTICIALSDGASSKNNSHFASETVTAVATKYLCNNFDSCYKNLNGEFPENLLNLCQKELISLEYDFCELSCTLLFFAIKDEKYIVGHIGDGIIFSSGKEGNKVLSFAENGEQPNETFFVNDKNAIKHFRVGIGSTEKMNAVILTSDGCASSLFSEKTKAIASAIDSFSTWINENEEKDVNLALEYNLKNLFSENTNDDMSIIIISL